MLNKFTVSSLYRMLLSAALLLAATPLTHALTDISNRPISDSATVDVKPNIMLLMDTSGSMGFSHMPDEVEGVNAALPIGYKSYQCNSIYYNPNTTYRLPKDASGVDLPTPSFNAARYNYYSTNVSVVDLGSAFQAYDNSTRVNQDTTANDTPQAAYYYLYTGPETLNYSTLPCTLPDSTTNIGQTGTVTTPGGGLWTRKLVGSNSGISPNVDERQNFAIWYTYYRTRMAMTKSSVGLAFAPLTNRFRVGFVTANPGTPVAPDKYLAIADFTTDNKAAWYDKVNSQVPSGSSPMREGLARVGRHYANMHDGINKGMDGDPVQYGCQKNFTLMTTDGYWNTAAETAGPVQLDGKTLVGQQDGSYTGDGGNTPYGVWDGGNTATRVTTNKYNTYTADATCNGGWVNKSTAQITQTDVQVFKSTAQAFQTTQQDLQSTSQTTRSTAQTLMATSITKKQTARTDATVTELRKSTVQNLESTSWWEKYTITTSQTVTQQQKSTVQNLESTQQMSMSTFQTLQMQQRIDQTVSQIFGTDTQITQTTAQMLQSTTRQTATTLQWMQSTARVNKTVTQVTQSTSQLNQYNGSTELSTPVASCTASGTISCYTVTSGPTLVASCTAATASSSNNYTTTTCNPTTVSGPAAAQTCTAAAASSANGYQTTTCTPVNTGPTAVATCTAASATSGNNWTTTTCTSNTTPATPVASPCSNVPASSANNYTSTTCSAPITTGPTAVQSCTPIAQSSSNNYTATTCTPNNTGPTGVSACTASAASSGNGWTTTTCGNNNVAERPMSSCTAQTAGAGNNWLGRTCRPSSVTTAVASCTAISPTSGNNYTTTACNTVTVSASAPVASCTAVAASSSNGFVSTICTPNNTGPAFVLYSSCVANPGTSSPFNRVVCTPTITTNVPVATCTANAGTSSPYLTRTCPTPVTTGPTDVASCTAAGASSGNSFITTTCPIRTVSGPTVMTCTVGTTTNGTGQTTTCSSVTSATVNVLAGSCTPGSVTVNGVTTVCTNRTTTNVPVATCTPNNGTTSPFVTRTCPTPITTGPTLVATCTAAAASSGNTFTTTTCAGPVTISGPIGVPSCTSGFNATTGQITTCTPVNTGPTAVDPATCVAATANSTNNYTTTTCPVTATGPAGASSCTASGPTSANGWMTTTCTPNNTGPTAVASCTGSVGNSGNGWLTTSCSTTTVSGPTPVASCTPVAAGSGNGYVATTCSTNNSGPVAVASCTASGKTSGNLYTATSCSNTTSGPTAVDPATCTPAVGSASNSYVNTICAPTTTSNLVASCTPATPNVSPFKATTCAVNATGPSLVLASACSAAAATSPNFISTTCVPVPGNKFQYTTTTSVLTQYLSGSTIITNPPAAPASVSTTAATDVDGICYTPNTTPVMPSLPTTQPSIDTSLYPGCTVWPCVVDTPNVVGGSNNSLADVAQYYYVTDLRPELQDLSPIIGRGALEDRANWQHMTTFALGLGVSGTLTYQADYLTSSTGDFSQIRPPEVQPPATPLTPSKNWPAWPDPNQSYADPRAYNNAKSIDDFWHAAVNGRGQYFSASNPAAVVAGLGASLSSIDSQSGAGDGVGVSNPNPVAGDNTSFKMGYKTVDWTGDITAQKVDLDTGNLSTTVDWSAQAKLDVMTAAACDNRKIYIRSDTNTTNHLANFSWGTRACSNGAPTGSADTGLNSTQQAMFGSTVVAKLGQYAAMTDGSNGTVDQRQAAAGANLVNFLRGQRGLEVPTGDFVANNLSTLYRKRAHVLGDIVDSTPVYVAGANRSYADAGYDTFKAAQASRTPMLYVGANDGMLHAIFAPVASTDPYFSSAGSEAWAYVPQPVMPELYRLADIDYKVNHRFFVDGSPVSGDVYDTTASTPAWKTILVGGLNAGGKGYFALDITDPVHPKSLWEFTQGSTCFDSANPGTATSDCHLGLSFGRPVITKLVDGTWVVLVTSGYNNVRSPEGTGDGHGYLYVLNAITGAIITKLDTGVGTATFPSGLREVNNYVANGALDNTTLRVYGGDLNGNIWRFDVNDNVAPPGKEATLVATAKDANGVGQPITTRLILAEVDGKTMIVAATGQFLGSSDATTTQTQSVYDFKDLLGDAVVYSDLRGSLRQTTIGTSGADTGKVVCTGGSTNCDLTSGWVLDLPYGGQRVNIDMLISQSTVTIPTNVPTTSACQAGGFSKTYELNLLTGIAAAPDGVALRSSTDSLIVGLSYVVLPDGRVIAIQVGADGSVKTWEVTVEPPKPLGRRVSWREIKK